MKDDENMGGYCKFSLQSTDEMVWNCLYSWSGRSQSRSNDCLLAGNHFVAGG